jgi:serine/threonine protein kinase/Tfp pilus assembly protein PilF
VGENIEVLVCKEALGRGLISRAQLEECLRRADTPPWSFLVSRGHLSLRQVEELRARVTRRLGASAATLPSPARIGAVEEGPVEVRAAREAGARTLGKYQIVRELGRGGMGSVHKAWDSSLRRWVALKILLGLGGRDEIVRFRREAQTAATLSHPGLVGVYEIGEDGDTAFIAMEFVEGHTLSGHPVPPPRACEIMIAVARAVDHAHRRGIIHRDLKPQNIMLDTAGQVRVMDFGLAKPLRERSRVTLTGTIVGTPSYMSPEQADGHVSQVDHRSDIYSLGAVLYELLTRRPPFAGRTVLETLTHVVEKDPVRPSKLNPGVPRDLETIVLRALDKEKTRRYPSAEALARDLERFLKGQAIEAKRLSIATQVSGRLRRHRILWLAGAAIVAIAVGTPLLLNRAASPPDVGPILALGDSKLAAGDLDGAITEYRAAETLVPGAAGSRLPRALDRKSERVAQAAQARKVAEDKAGSRERARNAALPDLGAGQSIVEKARLDLYKAGSDLSAMRELLDQAARRFTQALDLFPDYPEALLGRAQARALQGRPDDAARDLGRALEILPGYPAALLARGQLLLDRYMAYILPTGLHREDAPPRVRAWIEQSLDDLRKARDRGLKGADLEFCLASIAFAEDRPQEAVSILTRAIDAGARREEFHKLRGDAYTALGQKAGSPDARLQIANLALAEYTEAIRMRPNFLEAYRYRADLYFRTDHRVEWLADLRAGLRMNPNDSNALSDFAAYLHRSNRPDEALDYYARALAADPDNFRALSNRASIKLERKDTAGARADLERALAVNPDYTAGIINLAACRDLMGETVEAIDLVSKVIARQPTMARAFYTRGFLRYKLGRWSEALDDLEKAAGIDPAGLGPSTRSIQDEIRKKLGRP